MRLLLIHQNFPGQFRQLAPYLLQQGHDVVAICSHERPTGVNCGRFGIENRQSLQISRLERHLARKPFNVQGKWPCCVSS